MELVAVSPRNGGETAEARRGRAATSTTSAHDAGAAEAERDLGEQLPENGLDMEEDDLEEALEEAALDDDDEELP